MKDFFLKYLLFMAKTLTAAAAVVLGVAVIAALLQKETVDPPDRIRVTHLNDRYASMALTMKKHLLDEEAYNKEKEAHDNSRESKKTDRKRVFVLNFTGDVMATPIKGLREEITTVLSVARPEDQVVLRLESGGGLISAYGLAASQLQRIKDRNIPLTAAVDKVAASGGYMMACVADRLVAAPFAIVGSIGVISVTPNFHRLLKNNDIDYVQVTAGEYKRTVTMFDEITEKGLNKRTEQIQEAHGLFKSFVADHRSDADIERVATGEYWYASQAMDLRLVDELITSDDLLISLAETADIYEVRYAPKKTLAQKLSSAVTTMADAVWLWMRQNSAAERFQAEG